MTDFKSFMKANKEKTGTVKYAATRTLKDAEGKPLEWTLKPVSSIEEEKIREKCMIEKQVPGKRGQKVKELDSSLYIAKLICAAVVEPNLNNAELQDSYEVSTPEALLYEMVDLAGEYANFAAFVQKISGLDEDINDLVETAKN